MSSKFSAASLLLKSKPQWPSKDVLRAFRGNFGGIVVPPLTNGFPNKVLFTPGYVTEPPQVRQAIRQAYRQAGFTHFPLNLYNDSPIYRTFYPQWDDTKINDYLTELLQDGLIPVGSAFADGLKVVKQNVDPSLVPIVFTGWENAGPIARPALDADNLFYVAKQYFTNSLVYWHNPPYQGAPFVNPADWGGGPEPNAAVWNYMVHDSGCQGLLNQGQGWINGGADSVSRLNDFVARLVEGQDGWPVCDLVDFEQTEYYNLTMQGSPLLTGEFIRNQVPQLNGYCSG